MTIRKPPACPPGGLAQRSGYKQLDDLIYKEAVFYVMSGTGNTYRVSRWIEEIVNRHKVKAKVVMIEDADFNNDFNRSPDFLVGLLFPTHGFMPPWSMIKFLFRMPKRKNTPVMCVATRGALKIGSLQIPGAAGFAAFFAAILMFIKGYRVKAIFSLDMPSNFINFFSITTLTHYYRRYHQPETKLKHLAGNKRKNTPATF